MKTPISLRDKLCFAGLPAALCALILILILMPGSSAHAAGSAVPGRSVGHVFLGMDRADVWKILGRPRYTLAVPHGMELYGEDDWTAHGGYPNLTVTSLRDKVIQFEFDSSRITTTDGLRVHSTLAQVRRRHPSMTAKMYLVKYDAIRGDDDAAESYYLDDVRGGIAVTIAPYERITRKVLDGPVLSIIIHRPSIAAVPVYAGHWGVGGKDPDGLAHLRDWFTPHKGTSK